MDLDSILSEATHAARYFTDASGAALALWSQGVVICRARSGDTAPPLGSKLDMESGISGECLRSGRSKRCNDTLTDPLVDAQVCQELGIRSLAGVPLRGEHGVVGILEVFSDRPYAFSDAHITLLKQLAQIAVTGRSRSVPAAIAPAGLKRPAEANVAQPVRPLQTKPIPPQGASPFKQLVARMKDEEGQPLRLAAAGVLLLLVVGGFWWISARHKGANPPQSVQAATSNPTVVTAGPPLETSLEVTPSFGNAGHRTGATSSRSKPSPDIAARDLVRRASNSEVMDRTAPNEEKPLISVAAMPKPASDDIPTPEAPGLVPGTSGASVPESVLNSRHDLPTVALRMSQGVTGGALTKRVSPTYPQQARLLRIEGAVQLDATVGEDGNVHEVKVVKGDRILAAAAVTAVEQWRYQPFELNGKPVLMHTQVTIQFKLP
jgi:TonB family protein